MMFNQEVSGRHGNDHDSDPAHTPGDGWGEEGGASRLGPATHTDVGREPRHGELDGEDADPAATPDAD